MAWPARQDQGQYPAFLFEPLVEAVQRKMGRQSMDMTRIQRFIQDRVIVDSADLAQIAAICLSRLESAAARDEGKPFLRAKANRVDLLADGGRRLQVDCGDVAFGVIVPPQKGVAPLMQGDSVRLEYEKGVSPLSGPFTRVSRDWMAA